MPHLDRSAYRHLFVGDYASARVDPPVHGPSVYRRIARTVLDEHGLDPLTTEPEELARAEGFDVHWGSTPHRVGIHVGSMLILPWDNDPTKRALRIAHERSHGHLRTHGSPNHTEADAMWLTLELAYPSWLRAPGVVVEHAPQWLVDLVTRRKAA
jgi:hypothetical protein